VSLKRGDKEMGIGDWISDRVDNVTNVVEDGANFVGDAAGAVKDGVVTAAGAVKDGAVNAAGAVKDGVTREVDDTVRKLKDDVGYIADAGKFIGKLFTDDRSPLSYQETWDGLKAGWDGVRPFVKDVPDVIEELGQDAEALADGGKPSRNSPRGINRNQAQLASAPLSPTSLLAPNRNAMDLSERLGITEASLTGATLKGASVNNSASLLGMAISPIRNVMTAMFGNDRQQQQPLTSFKSDPKLV
jgi:hypothetical protein